MTETRAGKYGRNLAIWINYTINKIPEKEKYKQEFIKELNNYSFKPRKKEENPNEGCIHELSDLVNINIEEPKQFAKLVKESIHLMYQKQTSARVFKSLVECLEKDN